ncbi:hypothetical protein NHX12_013816 [Muraenolepis orangiensis]|uniref:Uncharacterized protein n=1 Tax=Muraenolepis orangiensis TaxID=630683 RepID=A0A9Q0DA63_9TELE|nr:hypothetical protein NHX12_013816 [Muraenolepis orangiensis]
MREGGSRASRKRWWCEREGLEPAGRGGDARGKVYSQQEEVVVREGGSRASRKRWWCEREGLEPAGRGGGERGRV